VGLFVAGCFGVMVVVDKFSRRAEQAKKEKRRERIKKEQHIVTPGTLYERLRDTQWDLIEARLGHLIEEEETLAANDDWDISSVGSKVKPRKCYGVIELYTDHRRDKYSQPLPLVKENLERLTKLGFRLSEDKMTASYVGLPEEATHLSSSTAGDS
jgi:hypothetical protein